MTVKDFIELLKKFPDDYKIISKEKEVWIDCDNQKKEIRLVED